MTTKTTKNRKPTQSERRMAQANEMTSTYKCGACGKALSDHNYGICQK
jgi:hypothetical protein